MKTSLNRIGRTPVFFALTALLFLSLSCDDERVGAGEGCELGADCEGALVCAHLSEGDKDQVCADFDDTYREPNCDPSEALDADGNPSTCGLVLKQAADQPCDSDKKCQSGQCSGLGDAGSSLRCAP